MDFKMALLSYQSVIYVTLLVTLMLLINSTWSVDVESTKERPCYKVVKTVHIDLEWLMSVKQWYWVVGSRYDLYEFTADVIKTDPKQLGEDDYYRSCPTWNFNPTDMSSTIYAFGAHKTYKFKPLDKHFGSAEFTPTDQSGSSGIAYTTLTDNKTFVFYESCYTENNQMVWSVASPYKSLPKKTVELIHEKAESLGFKREHFTGLRYDSCDKDEQGKDELYKRNRIH